MLFFLGKVFRRKEYATDFLEGRLFANDCVTSNNLKTQMAEATKTKAPL